MSEHEDAERARGLRSKLQVTGRLTVEEAAFLEEQKAAQEDSRGPLVRTEEGLTRIAPGAPLPEGGRVVQPVTPFDRGPQARRERLLAGPTALQRRTRTIVEADIAARQVPPPVVLDDLRLLAPRGPDVEAVTERDLKPESLAAVNRLAEALTALNLLALPEQVTLGDGFDARFRGIQEFFDRADLDPDAVVKEIQAIGLNPDTELILSHFGVGPDKIENFFAESPNPFQSFAKFADTALPGRDAEAVFDLFENDLGGFVEAMRSGGDTQAKRLLLRFLGFDNEQIQEVFDVQRLVLPLDGTRQLLTVDFRTGIARNQQGRQVGTYNTITREFDALPEESKWKDIWDAARYAAAGAWENTEGFFLSTVPNLLFRDLTSLERSLYGDSYADRVDDGNKRLRDGFRRVYSENREDFSRWLQANPDILPNRVEYDEGVLQHPALLLDPFYFAYETARITPYLVASASAAAATAVLTGGNPLAAVAAAGAVMIPTETEGLRLELLANGMPEDEADRLALAGGTLIASLEGLGHLPALRVFAPSLFKGLRRETSVELARLSAARWKKFGTTITTIQATEALTEVLQEAVGNAVVKIANEEQSLFEGLADIAAQTLVATAPLALVGGGVSARRVTPTEALGVLPSEADALGWVRDPETGNQYVPPEGEPITLTVPTLEAAAPVTIERPVSRIIGTTVEGQPIDALTAEPARLPEVPVTDEELPILTAQMRQVHREISLDIDIIQQDLKGQLRTSVFKVEDLGAKRQNLVMKGTMRELREAEVILRKIEADEKLTQKEIDTLKARVARLQAGATALKVKTLLENDAKTALINIIEATLPKSERGAFIRQVRAVRTPAQLFRAFDMVDAALERHVVRELRGNIRSELRRIEGRKQSGIERGKFTPEVEALLLEIREQSQVSAETAAELELQNLADFNEGKIDDDQLLERQEELRFTGQDAMDSVELDQVLTTIKDLKSVAREERKAEAEARKVERAAEVEVAVDEISGGLGIIAGAEAGPVGPGDRTTKRRAEDAIARRFSTLNAWVFNWNSIMEELSKRSKKASSFLVSTFDNLVNSTTNIERDSRNRFMEEILKGAEEAYGLTDQGELNQELNRNANEVVDLGTFTLTDEGGTQFRLRLTRDQIANMYHKILDPTLDVSIEEGMHWSKPMRDAIISHMNGSPQLKAWADFVLEFYRTYHATIAPVYERIYHTKLPFNAFYSPAFRQVLEGRAGRQQQVKLDESEHLQVFEEMRHFASTANRSLKERKASAKRPLRWQDSMLELLANHITQMEHFKAWSEPMSRMRGVFNNPDVRTAIRQNHGSVWVETIDWYMNTFARGGLDRSQMSKRVDALRVNFVRATLGIKPIIAVKQIPSVLGYMSQMPVLDFFQGTAAFWSNPIVNARFLFKNSSHYRARAGEGFERDIRDALRQQNTIGRLTGKGNFRDKFMAHIRFGDKIAVSAGMWAKMLSALKHQGLTRETASEAQIQAALFEAENATRRTQPAFELATLSRLQGQNSLFKLLTIFQNQPAQYYRMMAGAGRDLYFRRGNDLLAARTLLLTWIILPSLFQWIADGFRLRPKEQARAWVLGPLNFIPAASQIAQAAYNHVRGIPFDWGGTPVIKGIEDALDVVQGTGEFVRTLGQDEYGDFDWVATIELIEDLAIATGELKGLPTPWLTQVERALRGAVTEGDLTRLYELYASPYALRPAEQSEFDQASDVISTIGDVREDVTEREEEIAKQAGRLIELEDRLVTLNEVDTRFGQIFRNNLPQDIIKNASDPLVKSWAEKQLAFARAGALPNVPLRQIVDEGGMDVDILHGLWSERDQMTRQKDFDEFERLMNDPSNGIHLDWGNLTKQQLNLLRRYRDAEDRPAFLKAHPGLKFNPRVEFFKANPIDNARMALWGEQASSLLTQEAYDVMLLFISELKLSEDALVPLSLPPAESVETHFLYEAEVGKGLHAGPAAKLVLAKDSSYVEWRAFQPPDFPVAVYELLVEDQAIYDTEQELRDRLDGDEQDEAIDALKAKNPGWVDNTRRIEALKEGTDAEPTEDVIVEGWVERGKVVDKFEAGSAEAIVWLSDHEDVLQWAVDHDLLQRNPDWNIPVLRLTAKWRTTQARFDATDSDDRAARFKFKKANARWNDDMRRAEVFAWDPEARGAEVEEHVAYGNLVDERGASSAETMLWRSEHPGYDRFRAGTTDPLTPLDQGQVPIWKIDVKHERNDDRYNNIIPQSFANLDEASRAAAIARSREKFLEANPTYRKDRRRRDAIQVGISANQVENHVALYELPERGFRRERWLSEHPRYYNDVWLNGDILGNSAIDFAKVPDVRVDEIWEKWQPQMEEYYDGIPEQVRRLTGDARRDRTESLRESLFNRNPAFLEARIRYEGYRALVPDNAFEGYVSYYKILSRGKPEGWDRWWEDDRVLRDNPAFYAYALVALEWDPRDFSNIPSEAFERAYNEVYINLTKTENGVEVSNRQARAEFRFKNPAFDAEGVKAGLWKPIQLATVPARRLTALVGAGARPDFGGLEPTR